MVRPARVDDVPGIAAVMSRYVEQDVLLPRPVSELYQCIREFHVAELDGEVIACAALRLLWHDLGEVRSLAVSPDARGPHHDAVGTCGRIAAGRGGGVRRTRARGARQRRGAREPALARGHAGPQAQPRLGVRELLGHRARPGARRVRAARERGFDGERGETVVREHRVDREPYFQWQRLRRCFACLGGGPELADDAVRVTEGHALGHERVGELDREQIGGQRRGELVALRHERGNRGRQCLEQALEAVRRVEDGLFVFLQVLLVRARQALQEHGEPLRVGEQPRALSPREFEQVGVALLRQQAAAGAEAVGRLEPAEARRTRQHEILGEPRQVQAEHRRRVQVLERKVAIAHRVEAVGREAREAEPCRERVAVVLKRRARDGARTQRQAVGRLARRGEALLVAFERGDVREPEVREQHRLRRLQVRVRRARDVARAPRLAGDRALEPAHEFDGLVAQAHDAHAKQRRDLVVAAAAGVQPARGLAAVALEPGLDGRVHVLARERRGARRQLALERVARRGQPTESPAEETVQNG